MTLNRSLLLLLLVIAALSSLALASIRRPSVEPGLQVAKSGLVVDAQTREPLAGAYVVVRWLERSHGKISDAWAGQCLARTVVRSDAQGRYAIPASSFVIPTESATTGHEYFFDAYAYAPGRNLDSKALHPKSLASAIPGSQNLEPMLLAADHAAPEQRIDELADTLAHFACEPFAKGSGVVTEPVYAEAYAAACLPEPNRAVSALARLRGTADPCAAQRQASAAP